MIKRIFMLFLVLFSIVLIGCENESDYYCGGGYILDGNSCCKDANFDLICDGEPVKEETPILVEDSELIEYSSDEFYQYGDNEGCEMSNGFICFYQDYRKGEIVIGVRNQFEDLTNVKVKVTDGQDCTTSFSKGHLHGSNLKKGWRDYYIIDFYSDADCVNNYLLGSDFKGTILLSYQHLNSGTPHQKDGKIKVSIDE